MAITEREARLQRVIVGVRRRFKLVDVKKSPPRWREWPIVEWPCCRHSRVWRLIDVAVAEKLSSMRSNVANFQHAVSKQLALDVQVEVLNVRRAQVPINGENVRIQKVGIDWNA